MFRFIETIDISSLSPKALDILEIFFLESQDHEHFESVLLAYTPISSDLIDNNEGLLGEIIQIVHKSLSDNRYLQIAF